MTRQLPKSLSIAFASQFGTGEKIAHNLAQLASDYGLTAEVLPLNSILAPQLGQIDRLLVICSTYGDGRMPDNGAKFWQSLRAEREQIPELKNLSFAVLALGDSEYEHFCRAGKNLDQALSDLGAIRVLPLQTIDGDTRKIAPLWSQQALEKMAEIDALGCKFLGNREPDAPKSRFNRENPFFAKLQVRRRLTAEASSKEVNHLELDITGIDETYTAGDIAYIRVENPLDQVESLLVRAKIDGNTQVTWQGKQGAIADFLQKDLEIRRPSAAFFALLAERVEDGNFLRLSSKPKSAPWKSFIAGKAVEDFFALYPKLEITAQDLAVALAPLEFRAYSIASSSKVYPKTLHLTVGRVIYELEGERKFGLVSNALAQMPLGSELACFLASNADFSPPQDLDADMIMIGAGTGIAPFIGFLQEREAQGARGKNYLFFGERNRESDFLYQEELENWQQSGLLEKLELAFSRDQEEKIYVQDKLRACAAEVFGALERGAYLFICGDAARMAKAVEEALLAIIAEQAACSQEEALKYLAKLQEQKRFVRDVY